MVYNFILKSIASISNSLYAFGRHKFLSLSNHYQNVLVSNALMSTQTGKICLFFGFIITIIIAFIVGDFWQIHFTYIACMYGIERNICLKQHVVVSILNTPSVFSIKKKVYVFELYLVKIFLLIFKNGRSRYNGNLMRRAIIDTDINSCIHYWIVIFMQNLRDFGVYLILVNLSKNE